MNRGLNRMGSHVFRFDAPSIRSRYIQRAYHELMLGVHLSLGDRHPQRTGAHWSSHGQLPLTIADADMDVDCELLIRHGRCVRLVCVKGFSFRKPSARISDVDVSTG